MPIQILGGGFVLRWKLKAMSSPNGTMLSKPRASLCEPCEHGRSPGLQCGIDSKPQRGGPNLLSEVVVAQSLAQIYIHIVFSTKERRPWLREETLRVELYAYMATIAKNNVDSPALIINGVEDHVHLLIRLSRKFAIMQVIQECKVETSKWLKRQSTVSSDFAWQAGYGAFSVSASSVNEVKNYIQNQKEHHSRMSFQDELRELCRRHGVELDERYAWD
jgi:putative transposase